MSKQTTTDLEYEVQTIQNVFLRTVYQGLGTKCSHLRAELKLLLTYKSVTDEVLLRQVIKIESDERQRRLGQISRHRMTTALSVQRETEQIKAKDTTDQDDKTNYSAAERTGPGSHKCN